MRLQKLALLLLLLIAGCRENILHNLSEENANRSLTSLSKAAIPAQKELQGDGKWSISVSSDDVSRALSHLSNQRVLRSKPDISFSSSLGSTREEQRFLFERALAQQIEETLLSLEGVIEARVHLFLPPVDPLLGMPISKNQVGSASVLLIIDDHHPSIAEKDVAPLVSGASGVPQEAISVLLTASQHSPREDLKIIDFEKEKMSQRTDVWEQPVSLDGLPVKSLAGIAFIVCGVFGFLMALKKKKLQSPL